MIAVGITVPSCRSQVNGIDLSSWSLDCLATSAGHSTTTSSRGHIWEFRLRLLLHKQSKDLTDASKELASVARSVASDYLTPRKLAQLEVSLLHSLQQRRQHNSHSPRQHQHLTSHQLSRADANLTEAVIEVSRWVSPRLLHTDRDTKALTKAKRLIGRALCLTRYLASLMAERAPETLSTWASSRLEEELRSTALPGRSAPASHRHEAAHCYFALRAAIELSTSVGQLFATSLQHRSSQAQRR